MSQTGASEPKLGMGEKLFYSVGAMASSLKLRALSTFLLIFYNQVVGLPAKTVGLILMIAIVLDSLLDPIVGQWSDNFRSRWGRRHPFMLFSAIPFAVSFYYLWNPPVGAGQQAILVHFVVCLFAVRFFDTFFELPHQALAPELAKDYDGRTGLMAWRQLFMVLGGVGMTVLAYQVFLKEHPDGTGGVLARDGYFNYSLAGALIIFSTIVISTLGTASRIPHLSAPPARSITLMAMLREIGQTLNNRAFIAIALAGMLAAISVGVRNGLEIYFGLYFWELKQSQLATLATITVLGSFIGVALAPIIARVLGKRNGAITVWITAVLVHVTPVSLRLLGLAPENGTPELLVLIYGEEIVNSALAAAVGILLASTIADVVEDAEVKTGRRSEGLLFSANGLIRKVVSGAGIFIATAVLTFVGFPEGAKKGQVDADVLFNLGLAYVPTVMVLYGLAIGALCFFNISRARHEENLRLIAQAAQSR
jgi:glycoside/pentoside/hexuronide:cation symporter, GPH family